MPNPQNQTNNYIRFDKVQLLPAASREIHKFES